MLPSCAINPFAGPIRVECGTSRGIAEKVKAMRIPEPNTATVAAAMATLEPKPGSKAGSALASSRTAAAAMSVAGLSRLPSRP